MIRWRSTPNVPSTGAEREAHRLEHRALLDVQLEVGGGALELRPGLERPVEIDAVLAQRVGQRDAVRGPSSWRSSSWSAIDPAAALRAEERAAEARALLVGPVDEPDRHRRRPLLGDTPQHLDRRHDVQAAVEPAAVRDRVDVAAEQQRRDRRRRAACTTGCRPRRPPSRAAARRASPRATPARAPRSRSRRRAARRSRRRSARAARAARRRCGWAGAALRELTRAPRLWWNKPGRDASEKGASMSVLIKGGRVVTAADDYVATSSSRASGSR